MAHARKNFFQFLLILFAIVDQLQIPVVICQEGDEVQCLPRKTFFAFIRLPELTSNLAAYSRSARIIQDVRNNLAHLKAISSENNDDAKICLPMNLYYDIFNDPVMRTYLSAIERAQRMMENPEPIDLESINSEKRSIATLAKNGDLPVSIQERMHNPTDDEEKRSQSGVSPEEILKMYTGHTAEELGKNAEDIISTYTLSNGELDVEGLTRDFRHTKRNVGSLARDFALPSISGRRNFADYLLNGKRNIASLARDKMLPNLSFKRFASPLGRIYIIPSFKEKRNIATLARDSALPMFGKRYLGSVMRSGGIPYLYDKRGIASLARNGVLHYTKRNIGTLARDRTLPPSRHSRSLTDKELDNNDMDYQRLDQMIKQKVNDNTVDDLRKDTRENIFEAELVDAKNKSRSKRQVDYSEEYPLPVMQNTNVFDYDDILEALVNDYPVAEKRFMGLSERWNKDDDDDDDDDDESDGDETFESTEYQDVSQPSKRHIGALARLGWLPYFRAARFSRSPRYLVAREDPSNGSTSNNTPHSSTRSLKSYDNTRPRTRYFKSLQNKGCPPGIKSYLQLH